MLNLMSIQAGQRVRLINGTVVEVAENIGDGIWLQLRNPESGEEELVHCEEVLELVENSHGEDAPGNGSASSTVRLQHQETDSMSIHRKIL